MFFTFCTQYKKIKIKKNLLELTECEWPREMHHVDDVRHRLAWWRGVALGLLWLVHRQSGDCLVTADTTDDGRLCVHQYIEVF